MAKKERIIRCQKWLELWCKATNTESRSLVSPHFYLSDTPTRAEFTIYDNATLEMKFMSLYARDIAEVIGEKNYKMARFSAGWNCDIIIS